MLIGFIGGINAPLYFAMIGYTADYAEWKFKVRTTGIIFSSSSFMQKIGLGIGGFFDFVPRAGLLAGSLGLAIGTYQHVNVRFNTPKWWRFLFNTTEHHSLHHSQDYESTRSNYAGSYIFIDRMFGTCIDGEAELLGMEGGRRMSIREQMTFPFHPLIDRVRAWRTPTTAVPAE